MDMASLHYMSQTKTETLNGDLARRVLELSFMFTMDNQLRIVLMCLNAH